MPDNEYEIYERFCKDKFDAIITRQDKILECLQGTGEHAGLVEDVRGLKKVYRAVVGAVVSILVLIGGVVANWIHHKLTN